MSEDHPIPSLEGAAFRLEALDLAMLRMMYREGADSLSGIDPRLNASSIARSLGTGRSRVAARLRQWEGSGFLSNYAVWLNPALLDYRGAWATLQVKSDGDKPEVIRRLGLTDGVVSATEFLGKRVNLGVVCRDRIQLERRLELIRGLTGVAEAVLLAEWSPRNVHHRLTPLEVRLIRVLRAKPTATLEDTAGSVGTSVRTLARKYAVLLEKSVIWFQPMFDFRRLSSPLVVLRAELLPGTDPGAITRELTVRYPLLVELADVDESGMGLPGAHEWGVVLPSAACIDEMTQFARSREGVKRAEWKMPLRTYDFPTWFNERLRELTVAGTGP